MTFKPNKLPVWASGADAEKIEPSSAKQKQGWERYSGGKREKPFFQYFNWWQNLIYRWISYFNDEAVTKTGEQAISNKTLDKVKVTGFIELEERGVKPFFPAPDSLRLFAKKEDDALYLVNSNNEEFSLKGERGRTADSINLLDCSLLPSTDTDGNLLIELRTFEGDALSTTNPARIAFKVYMPKGEFGQNWSAINLGATGPALALVNRESTFVSGGKKQDTNNVSLNEGLTWSHLAIDMVNALASGDSGFVAVGDRCRTVINPEEPDQNINEFGGGYRSSNGVTWENVEYFYDKTLHGVAYKDGTYIATGNKAYDNYDVCSAESAFFNEDSYIPLDAPEGNIPVSSGDNESIFVMTSQLTGGFVSTRFNYVYAEGSLRRYYQPITRSLNGASTAISKVVLNLVRVSSSDAIFVVDIVNITPGANYPDNPIIGTSEPIAMSAFRLYNASTCTLENTKVVFNFLTPACPDWNHAPEQTYAVRLRLLSGTIGTNGANVGIYWTTGSGEQVYYYHYGTGYSQMHIEYGLLFCDLWGAEYTMGGYYLVQPFYAPAMLLSGLSYKLCKLGTPSGLLYIDITDSEGTLIATSGYVVPASLPNSLATGDALWVTFPFSSPKFISANNLYRATLKSTAGFSSANDVAIVTVTGVAPYFTLQGSPTTRKAVINAISGQTYVGQTFSSLEDISRIMFKIFKSGTPTAPLAVDIVNLIGGVPNLSDVVATSVATSKATTDIVSGGITSDTTSVVFSFDPPVPSSSTSRAAILRANGAGSTSDIKVGVDASGQRVIMRVNANPHMAFDRDSYISYAPISKSVSIDPSDFPSFDSGTKLYSQIHIYGQTFVISSISSSIKISHFTVKLCRQGVLNSSLAVQIVGLTGGSPNLNDVKCTSEPILAMDLPALPNVTFDNVNVLFSFMNPVLLDSSTEYALVIRMLEGDSGDADNYVSLVLYHEINNQRPCLVYNGITWQPGFDSLYLSLTYTTVPFQTFRPNWPMVAPSTHTPITRIDLNLLKIGSPTVSVVLDMVSPSNLDTVLRTSSAVLTSSLQPYETATQENTAVTFNFDPPFYVDAANEYAVLVRVTGSGLIDEFNTFHILTYVNTSVLFAKIKHYGKPFLEAKGGFYTSTNTVDWSFSEFNTSTPLNRVKATYRGFLTTTTNGSLYRKNGTNWDVVIPNFEMFGCASDELCTIVVGSSSEEDTRVPKCYKSVNDVTWEPVTIVGGIWFTDITVSSNVFLAVGDAAYLSKDQGTTWNSAPVDSSGWPEISSGAYMSIAYNPISLTCVVTGGVSGTNYRVASGATSPDLKYVMQEVGRATELTIPKESTLGVYDANTHKMHVYALNVSGVVRLAAIVRGCRPENKSVYATSVLGLKSQDCLGAEVPCQNVVGRYLGTLSVYRVDNNWFALPSVTYDNPYPTPYSLTAERAKTFNRAHNGPINHPFEDVSWDSACWSPELGMFCVVGTLD